MRALARMIASGFGWTLGAAAAEDVYKSVKEALAEPEAKSDKAPSRSPAELKKAAAKVAKERAARKQKFEREVDEELRAMKKKLRK